jgi:hypothetical protein
MNRKQNAQRLAGLAHRYDQIIKQHKLPKRLTEDDLDTFLSSGIGTITLDAVKRMKKKI